jgi:LCP family protein required for cell wall assembly
MTSIPRDLYVYIPGWTMQRINTAMAYGGFHTLGMTLAYNLGVYPDHYIMVNFSNFVSIVDSLDGIDVHVAQNFSDNRSGYGWYTVKEGIVHMDGETALWYVRSRYSSSDIDRLRRAQEVIQAIGYRLLNFDVLKRAPALYRIYKDSVTTDIGFSDIGILLPLAKMLVEIQDIHRYSIGYGPVYDWTEPYTGAMLLLPNRSLIMPIMREALNVR